MSAPQLDSGLEAMRGNNDTRVLWKPGEFAHDAVGESEVCAAKRIINTAFWLVLWLGPEDNLARGALGQTTTPVVDFARLAASRLELVIQAQK